MKFSALCRNVPAGKQSYVCPPSVLSAGIRRHTELKAGERKGSDVGRPGEGDSLGASGLALHCQGSSVARGPSLSLCFACHLKGLDREHREAPPPGTAQGRVGVSLDLHGAPAPGIFPELGEQQREEISVLPEAWILRPQDTVVGTFFEVLLVF